MATPTTYTNQATWFANTYPKLDWKELSSGKREKYRAEYKSWVESLPTTTTPTEWVTEPEPTTTAPTTTTPTVEEQIALMPEAPTLVTPELAPTPTVTPAPTVEAPEVPVMPGVTPAPELGAPTVPVMPGVTPAPTIPAIEVAPAPEYVPSKEEQVWAEMYGGTIQDIIEAGGLGIDEATQQLMIRQQTQLLTAREDENLRLMANDMERRGITNSGLVFWREEQIKSATTTALANSITDIQIKSSLMKMASFENALGHAGQFLGYLQEQSKMIYMGKMATWEAQTQANLIQYQAQISSDLDHWKMVNQFKIVEWEALTQAELTQYQTQSSAALEQWRTENQYSLAGWQANTQALFAQWDKNSTAMIEAWKLENQFSIAEWQTQANYDLAVFQIEAEALMANWSAQTDIYKLSIAQAYAQGNMNLAAQINATAAAQQHIWDIELAEMEIEANQKAAAAEGGGKIIGTLLGGLLSLITG